MITDRTVEHGEITRKRDTQMELAEWVQVNENCWERQTVSFRQACMNQREVSGIVGCRREAARRTTDENRNDARLSRLAGAITPAFRAVAWSPRGSLAYPGGVVDLGGEGGWAVRT